MYVQQLNAALIYYFSVNYEFALSKNNCFCLSPIQDVLPINAEGGATQYIILQVYIIALGLSHN